MQRIRFLNPITDEDFARTVESIVAEGVRTPSDLEDRLRDRYPVAVVRERDLAGEDGPAWYVYRDGHWIPGDGDRDGPGESRATEDLRTTAAAVRADATRMVAIEADKEDLPADDARRVALSQEATDVAERLALETNVEEMLAHEVADPTDRAW